MNYNNSSTSLQQHIPRFPTTKNTAKLSENPNQHLFRLNTQFNRKPLLNSSPCSGLARDVIYCRRMRLCAAADRRRPQPQGDQAMTTKRPSWARVCRPLRMRPSAARGPEKWTTSRCWIGWIWFFLRLVCFSEIQKWVFLNFF